MSARAKLVSGLQLGRVLTEGVIACAIIHRGLAHSNLPALCARLGVALGQARSEPILELTTDEDPKVRLAVRTTLRLSRTVWRKPTCLQQSLLAGFLLRSSEPVLRIGWWKTPESQAGHAWIEIGGKAVAGLSGGDPHWTEKIGVLGRSGV